MSDSKPISADFAALGLTRQQQERTAGNELGQQEFFDLMIAQLQNQDPLKPLEANEFLSQVAQFTQLSGIQEMNNSINLLASSFQSAQALQASTLVGREVSVAGNVLQLGADAGASGAVQVPSTTAELRVSITTPAGVPVRTLALGSQSAGTVQVRWDGSTSDGERAPPGLYVMRAEALYQGQPLALETMVSTRVESVTLGRAQGGLTLNLTGVGPVAMSDIRELL